MCNIKFSSKYYGVISDREIQTGEHCSVEDALAAMHLYKLVQEEWEITVNRKNIPHTKTMVRQNKKRSYSTESDQSEHEKSFLDDDYWPEGMNGQGMTWF